MTTVRPLALVFPGQGAHKLGMGRDFFDHYHESRHVFDEASSVLAMDVPRLCFEESERLALTEFQQPAILTVEIAMLAALRARHGWMPRFFGGHSLGEYTALVAAGVFRFEDALRIVRLRGRLMQEAVPAGVGAMTAIIHRDLDTRWLHRFAARFNVDVGNHNGLDQAVLSGMEDDVNAAVAALKAEPEVKARAIALRVSAPFHSRHMKSVEEPLRRAFENLEHVAGEHSVKVVSNTTGTFHTGSRYDVERRLVEQVTSTVRWVEDMRELLDRNCEIVEVGPGRPLRGFFASLDVEIRSVTTVESIAAARG